MYIKLILIEVRINYYVSEYMYMKDYVIEKWREIYVWRYD